MSRSKFILLLALLVLLAVPVAAVPVAVQAQTPELISTDPPEGTGTAVISDDAALGDSITISMTGVTPPSEGTAYEGWLVSDDGATKMSTGVMTVAIDRSISHTFNSLSEGYTGDNLIVGFNTFVITVEPVPDADPEPSGIVVFGHSIPPDGMAHIRHLLADWPPGSGVGILTDLKAQLDVAIQHAEFAASSETIEGVKTHIQHVINIIEGEDGANFDATAANPGDGIGIIAHAQNSKHGPFAAAAVPDDTVIGEHAALVEASGANVENWSNTARDIALNILGTSDLGLAKIFVGPGGDTVVSTLMAARSGFDGDGDGTVGSGTGEGGADQAYVEAQLMATFTLEPGSPVQLEPTTPPKASASGLQPTAPGLPGVGDPSVPLMAQLALVVAVVLLGTGGIFMVMGRRSKKSI